MKRKRYSQSGKAKNAIVEGLTILVVVVLFAIGGLFVFKVFDDLNTDIQADDSIDAGAKANVNNLFVKYPSLMDNLFLFMFIMFTIFVVASVFFVDTHPIFFIVSAILLIAVFIVAVLVGNVYDELATDSELSAYANQMPYMSFIMRHIVEMIIGIGFVTSIALFIKIRG